MKKALIMLLLLVAVVGSFGMTQAAPPAPHDCVGPVDLDCDVRDDEGNVTAHCLVYVNLGADDPGVGIICQEAPAA